MTTKKQINLVPIQTRPFNAETPMELLAEPQIPTSLFYVRNHFDLPTIDAEKWRLVVEGAVNRPLRLSLSELKKLTKKSVVLTLECAGNGRKFMNPLPGGTPWVYGAVSTAQFTGVPLHLVLHQAGVRPEAVEVVFEGADQGEAEPGRVVSFARSLPLDQARHADTLLAWEMNGEPLTEDHGFPLRLVVPRWYGMASVKWLVKILVVSKPFDGYFQKERYIYAEEHDTPNNAPVNYMRVRALIGRPVEEALLPPGTIEVAGTAWSGFGSVTRVEVSTNNGQSWSKAELGTAASPYAATPWRFLWKPTKSGQYTLMARATDSAGNSQPLESVWNKFGYGNNVVQRVQVRVE